MRKDFPIFGQKIRGKKLIYFDSAATSQKPKQVIGAVSSFYRNFNSNVRRGLYFLSQQATDIFEKTREKAAEFIGAAYPEEIVFVRGATEAINLAARTFGEKFIKKGDEVLISHMEHHSNIVPWQMVCQKRRAALKVIPVTRRGELKINILEKLLTKKTKILALTHVSNVLGTINPVKAIVKKAREKNIAVLIDGAQAVGHLRVDVQDLGCDFYAFSGHKMYGPTGIGVLWGRKSLLEKLDPWQGGGEMIARVTFEKTIWSDIPYRFEAGTPNIAGAVGLGAAIDYINKIGLDRIFTHEQELLKYGERALSEVEGVSIIGKAKEKTGIISFVMAGVHPHDIAAFLDQEGIALRTGHHCCQPLMEFFKIPGTLRVSFGIYNTKKEIDKLKLALREAKKFFHV